jgi:hypothetical protein
LKCCSLVLVALLTAACQRGVSIAGTSSSPEAAAAAVLDALARKDRSALAALALSEREFEEHVWPGLPAARPERNLPLSYVWGDLHQKSEMSLERTLQKYGGRRLTLKSLRFSGYTDYPGYRVHRATTLRVTDVTGEQTDLRIFGSLLEKEGAWKVFSYVAD